MHCVVDLLPCTVFVDNELHHVVTKFVVLCWLALNLFMLAELWFAVPCGVCCKFGAVLHCALCSALVQLSLCVVMCCVGRCCTVH